MTLEKVPRDPTPVDTFLVLLMFAGALGMLTAVARGCG